VHNLACYLTCEFIPPRIRETARLGQYRSTSRSFAWTDEELARIRLVLRKLTALRVENPEDAEDLVQETLLTMVRKAPEIDLEKGLLIWAMGILRKKVGNYYRRTQRSVPLDDQRIVVYDSGQCSRAAPSPEASLLHAELCARVDALLENLPVPEREAMDLYLAGTQTCEIVSLLHPERYQNVVNRLHRGRKKLAKELTRHGYAKRRPGKAQITSPSHGKDPEMRRRDGA
jgi:RNA polymerase sigma factor (sigma-70 family)